MLQIVGVDATLLHIPQCSLYLLEDCAITSCFTLCKINSSADSHSHFVELAVTHTTAEFRGFKKILDVASCCSVVSALQSEHAYSKIV